MADRYLDDFSVGERFTSDGVTVTESLIVDFALRYDPQPFHLDAEAAKHTVFAGLVASGFHTMALTYRMFYQLGEVRACMIAASGIDELKWLGPVRAGDTIHVEAEVLEVRPSRSKLDRGTLRIGYTTRNQRGEAVLFMNIPHIARRRPED